MNDPKTYALPEALLQGMVSVLSTMPAGQVRHLLNAVEAECVRQDGEREQAAKEAWVRQAMAAQMPPAGASSE